MTTPRDARRGSRAEILLGIAIFALTAFQLYQSTKVATTPRGTPAREALQQLHYSIGLTVLLLVIPRLWLWWKNAPLLRPARVPASSDAFARQICVLFYFTVFFFGLTGPMLAWADNHHISWFGLVPVPNLVEPSYRLVALFGYLHSAIGMWIFGLLALGIVTSAWQFLRYRAPLLRMLPGMAWSRSA